MIDIEAKIAEYRTRWLNEPKNRSTIETQVKILNMARRAEVNITQDTFKPSEPFTQSVKEALF